MIIGHHRGRRNAGAGAPDEATGPADIGIEPYGARPGDTIPVPVRLEKGMERLRIKTVQQEHPASTRPFWNLPLIHGLG